MPTPNADRPDIQPLPTSLDRALQGAAIAGFALLLFLPIYFYDSLPEQVPQHFDAQGKPDSWGSRNVIFLAPVIGAVLFFGLTYLNRSPRTFNYLVPITRENAGFQYRNAQRMIRFLNAFITLSFAYITHQMIQTALGKAEGLGNAFLSLFLMILFGALGYFTWLSYKHK